MSPRVTQWCFFSSAQTSSGGSTTSALSRATATFSVTIRPKSRSSGSDDVAITATPAIAVQRGDDERAAGPRRGHVDRGRGEQPAPALLDEAQQDQRRELGARRDHERSADRRHRAQLEAEHVREQRRGADRDQHRHEREQRADDAAQPDHEEHEDEEDREVGQQDPVRLEVVEQADADDREARRRGARRPSGGFVVVADLADDDRALVEAARAGAEDEVQRAGRRVRGRELDVSRRDVVRGLHLLAGRRDVGRAGDVAQVADDLDDARCRSAASPGTSASCSRVNVVEEADGLVVEVVVRLHEHAELARRAGLLVDDVRGP